MWPLIFNLPSTSGLHCGHPTHDQSHGTLRHLPPTCTDHLLNLDTGDINFLGKLPHCLIRIFIGKRVYIDLHAWGHWGGQDQAGSHRQAQEVYKWKKGSQSPCPAPWGRVLLYGPHRNWETPSGHLTHQGLTELTGSKIKKQKRNRNQKSNK